jgi:hypothetical protein
MSKFWRGYLTGFCFMLGWIFSSFYIVKDWDTRKSFEKEAVLNNAGKYVRSPEGKTVFLWTYCPQDQQKE